jgi:HK97 gp10 family phage protein
MAGGKDALKIEGLKELQKKLLELKGGVGGQKVLAAAARKAMMPVRDRAAALAPRDTGVLAESIIVVSKKPTSGKVVASAGIKVKVSGAYKEAVKGLKKSSLRKLGVKTKSALARRSAHWRWHFVEKGTSKMKAEPFIRPAFRQNKQRMLDILKAELQKSIKKIVKKQGGGGE